MNRRRRFIAHAFKHYRISMLVSLAGSLAIARFVPAPFCYVFPLQIVWGVAVGLYW